MKNLVISACLNLVGNTTVVVRWACRNKKGLKLFVEKYIGRPGNLY